MTKKVSIAHPRAVNGADDFVNRKPEAAPAEPMKRLTIDIPESLHTKMKLACVADRKKMSEAVREMLDERWGTAA
jgi:hypothetical protein